MKENSSQIESKRPRGRPKSEAKGDLAAALRERQDAQSARLRRQIADLLKTHLPADEAARAWAGECDRVRTTLGALPVGYAERLAEAATTHGVAGAERAIRDMVDAALTELAAPTCGPIRRRRLPPLKPSASLTAARARTARLKAQMIYLQEQVVAGRELLRQPSWCRRG